MENPAANQLPEVDSLPDGFVNSSSEPLAPQTPTSELEKPLANYKEDNFSEVDGSSELLLQKQPANYKEDNYSEIDSSSESKCEVADNEHQSSLGGAEKTQKLRTFPVPLSGRDSSDASVDLVEVPNRSNLEQTEGTLAEPSSVDPVLEASVKVSGCSEVKEQVQGESQSSKTCIEGGSDSQENKEISSSEITGLLKNRKLETSETKRKSAKRAFKSEKEFLEFTLKYQQVLAERDAAINVRDKLESLCRELQRQNKMLMDECKRVSTEGQTLRLDLSAKFQDAIKDVSNKLDEQKDECLSQLKENEMLRIKLKQLADQYTLTEQQHAQKLKQKTLELQLSDLKIKQHEEKLLQEQSQMKLYAEQVTQLLATEKNLRLQLTADGEKFQQFQDALLKSNEVFGTFKQEIDKMSKSIKELKKENTFLRSKCEKSDITLIELVEERESFKKQLEKAKKQKEKLASLCRSLQAERKQNSIGSSSSDSLPI